jgi:hypothetical protein
MADQKVDKKEKAAKAIPIVKKVGAVIAAIVAGIVIVLQFISGDIDETTALKDGLGAVDSVIAIVQDDTAKVVDTTVVDSTVSE